MADRKSVMERGRVRCDEDGIERTHRAHDELDHRPNGCTRIRCTDRFNQGIAAIWEVRISSSWAKPLLDAA